MLKKGPCNTTRQKTWRPQDLFIVYVFAHPTSAQKINSSFKLEKHMFGACSKFFNICNWISWHRSSVIPAADLSEQVNSHNLYWSLLFILRSSFHFISWLRILIGELETAPRLAKQNTYCNELWICCNLSYSSNAIYDKCTAGLSRNKCDFSKGLNCHLSVVIGIWLDLFCFSGSMCLIWLRLTTAWCRVLSLPLYFRVMNWWIDGC